MYRVLMAVDEDEQQAESMAAWMERLAEEVDELEVIILHVFRDVDIPSQVVVHEPLGDFKETHHEQREIPSAVTDVVDRLRGSGIDAQIRIERGEDPAETIIAFAEDEGNDVDNVFIGGRKSSPVGKAIFGSIAQTVLLNTDIPVTVAGARE